MPEKRRSVFFMNIGQLLLRPINAVRTAARREFKGYTTDELLEMSRKLEETSGKTNLALAKYGLAHSDQREGGIRAYVKPRGLESYLKPEFNAPLLALTGEIKTSELGQFRDALLWINREITKVTEGNNFEIQPEYNTGSLKINPITYWK